MSETSKRPLVLAGVFAACLLFALAGPSASEDADPTARVFGGGGGRSVEVAQPRRGPIATTIQAPGTIQAGSEAGASAPFDGKVLELVKDEGDQVTEGEVVFRLDPQDNTERLSEARIDLQRKEAARREAEVELSEARRVVAEAAQEPAEVTEARLRLRQSDLSLQRSRAELDASTARMHRAEEMLAEGIGRKVDVEAARSEHSVASIAVRIAQEELILARETTEFRTQAWERSRHEANQRLTAAESGLVRGQADLETAQLAVDRAQRDLERCAVRAPLSGMITARSVNRGELVSRPAPDTAHYIVSDLDHLLVYSDVDEGDVVRVAQGQRADVSIAALDDRTLRGAVYDVALRGRVAQGEEVTSFRVRILLAPGQEELAQLRPGMTANVEIETGRVDEALKVPLQAILRRERSELPDDLAERLPEQLRGALPAEDASAAEDAKGKKKAKEDDLLDVVYVVKDGVAKVRVLKLGLTDSDEAEVEAGLEPDARVVVGPYRALEELRDGATVEAKEAEELLLSGDDDDGVAATESRSRG